MIVAIVGGRGFSDLKIFNQGVYDFTKIHGLITKVVSGGAKGADTMAANFAKRFQIELIEFIPDWEKFGKSAGYRRNKDIVEASEAVIAFWDGQSKGTKHSIDIAKSLGKIVHIVYY
jgi:hypothetical protein